MVTKVMMEMNGKLNTNKNKFCLSFNLKKARTAMFLPFLLYYNKKKITIHVLQFLLIVFYNIKFVKTKPMKRFSLLLFVGLSLNSFSQQNSEKDTIASQPIPTLDLDVFQEKILFQDRDLLILRKTNPNGKDFVTLNFGGNTPIEISNQGEIKVQNRIVAKNLLLTNVAPQEAINPKFILDLEALEKYINKNKKLPSFPSKMDLKNSGIDVADFQMKLLKDIEELTLTVIDQNNRIEKMEKDIKKMKIIMVNKSYR